MRQPASGRRTVVVIGFETAKAKFIEDALSRSGIWDVQTRAPESIVSAGVNSTGLPAIAVVALDVTSRTRILHCVRRLRSSAPVLPILAITEASRLQDLCAALAAGATALLVEPVHEDVLAQSVSQAALGHRVLCPVAQGLLVGHFHDVGSNSTVLGFTMREREVLECVSRGLRDKEIGEELRISEGTVHAHLRRVFERLGVNTRRKAAEKYSTFMRQVCA